MTEKLRPLLAILLLCLAGNGPIAAQNHDDSFAIRLVRHAEKAAGGPDPDLTEFGRSRAGFFADWMADQGYRAVWSSDFRRTRSTALPVAQRLGVELQIYDPGDQAALVENLLAAKVNAFVVGHSNTIPELAAMLCECEVAPMDDSDYERTFLVIKHDHATGIAEDDLRTVWIDRPERPE